MRIRPIVSSGVSVAVTATTLAAVVASSAAPAAAAPVKPAAHKHAVASVQLSNAKPAVGKTVVINFSHSRLPKGDHLRKVRVRFGDGSKAVVRHSLKSLVRHTYKKAGTYKVVVTIVDRHGVKVAKSKLVRVHSVHSSTPPPAVGLPLVIPTGLVPTSLISSLNLPLTTLTSISSLVGIPAGTLDGLPVAFLGLLPAGDLTGAGLPSLPGLAGVPVVGDLVSLLSGSLGGLPIMLPTNAGLTASQPIGSVPTSILSTVQLGTLSTLFGVPTSALSGLPLKILALLPGNLLQFGTPGGGGNPPPSTGLPITIPVGLLPTSLISSLGLPTNALSSISSLLNIPTGTLSGLPVGFLSLLPGADLTGAALPSLPGLGSLPLVGNVVGMLLAGLPISIPNGTDPTTLISALPSGVLSLLQLTTLSTFFGIPTSVLDTLPVNVLTLLPTGMLNGL